MFGGCGDSLRGEHSDLCLPRGTSDRSVTAPQIGGGASQKEEAAVGKKPNPIPGQPLTLKEKILWTLALVAWVLMILIT